ncbi:translation initiation factor eIF-1A [Candidatus Woesearchaeota archaeon]|jgi:translation initiation factor 1A|nr:translation initiation factor eIF-1A [Candidatus Woesearchaeota archaeon]MBT4387146.1 translation initiation factor eIF-1A [Candidatus Woesearchaeota archaeon]MBT4596097.1 translation initiation factor eIF-1A [Candidatus Woesearchaeota archaeon]MBT5741681.1 translation initiation factor eIF-1A [Candidatus Woesearchaeota archaeon]MBT6505791.1 translation initiation factor eIF-1A [Candidatus Woesearchaeota archaeon]
MRPKTTSRNKTYRKKNTETTEIVRVRLPKEAERELLAVVDQRLGGSRLRVRCFDGLTRIARIPGKYKRRLWIREGDTVIIIPWEFGGDEKADLIFKYTPNQVGFLKRKGMLSILEDGEEF